ncbi:MAG: iron-containing alcohol dehydrogenase [Paracoccaceae bacterium]
MASLAFPHLEVVQIQDRAVAFCEALAELSRECRLPQRLSDMNITEDWLPRLARDAMNQGRLLVNNPHPVLEADALAIYRAAF